MSLLLKSILTFLLIFCQMCLIGVAAELDKSYPGIKADIQEAQAKRISNFKSFQNSKDRKTFIEQTRQYLLRTIANEIFPAWYGTKWSFGGMTRTPGEGSIACGYFVTHTLTDLGFDIPRIRWAQAASETMIKEMTGTENIKRFSNASMDKIEAVIENWGEGLYVVGLDQHTGFILNYAGKIRFVHADYYNAETGVKSQKLSEKSPLFDSKYRVIGKILDDKMVEGWLSDN